ncbi:hypothetical protein KCH_05180 [Kitasatospora cheerisanensis KCTC 2395]|uniref:Uncharacterized protein n=1 Tax=Kitasatospora cheerisanensis KCTC 2395 TaxID=1348663 RepID=A0A066ZC24_9ACTN|nr:hypothetical protein KCH_05180 [Kitasatospora cheerisanensis KCTC 2395]
MESSSSWLGGGSRGSVLMDRRLFRAARRARLAGVGPSGSAAPGRVRPGPVGFRR